MDAREWSYPTLEVLMPACKTLLRNPTYPSNVSVAVRLVDTLSARFKWNAIVKNHSETKTRSDPSGAILKPNSSLY